MAQSPRHAAARVSAARARAPTANYSPISQSPLMTPIPTCREFDPSTVVLLFVYVHLCRQYAINCLTKSGSECRMS